MPTQRKGAAARWSVTFEHRKLGALFMRVREALARQEEGRQSARQALERLTEAMEAHFGQEESLYYPTIWALRPDYKQPLHDLLEIHPHIRERLAELAEALESDAHAEVEGSLEGLSGMFRQHESAEERLLHSLDLGPSHHHEH
jgi:hemerythrin